MEAIVPKINKIVALYLRVSTQDQNVESQSRALTDWCSKLGIFNYELFTDHGISGAKGINKKTPRSG